MALIAFTNQPTDLKHAIEKEVEADRILTWERHPDGTYYHAAASGQWADEAVLTLQPVDGALIVSISGPSSKNLTVTAYAIYHGRFAEMLLGHFDKMFTTIHITALLSTDLGDRKRET